MLVRHFIGQRLSEYYGQAADKVVGSVAVKKSVGMGRREGDGGLLSSLLSSCHETYQNNNNVNRLTSNNNTLLSDYFKKPSIQFSSLWGHWHWNILYHHLYKTQSGQWLTPVELFRPLYSHVVANFIISQVTASSHLSPTLDSSTSNFDVIELGGGRGTNAIAILLYLQEFFPHIYSKLDSYMIYDSSDTLLQFQKELMQKIQVEQQQYRKEHQKSHLQDITHKIQLIHRDLVQVADHHHDNQQKYPFVTPSTKPTVTLALELLDNLPHDQIKVVHSTNHHPTSSSQKVMLQQAHVQNQSSKSSQIYYQPIQDTLIQYLLSTVPEYITHHDNYTHHEASHVWLPTTAAGILRRLFFDRPNTSLLLADFDYLPPPNIPLHSNEHNNAEEKERIQNSIGNPLVTDMNGIDYKSFLNAPPLCDILFPTDFRKLATFLHRELHSSIEPHVPSKRDNKKTTTAMSSSPSSTCQQPIQIMKQSSFLLEYGRDKVNSTRNRWTGYSPLLEDFSNCSVLIRLNPLIK